MFILLSTGHVVKLVGTRSSRVVHSGGCCCLIIFFAYVWCSTYTSSVFNDELTIDYLLFTIAQRYKNIDCLTFHLLKACMLYIIRVCAWSLFFVDACRVPLPCIPPIAKVRVTVCTLQSWDRTVVKLLRYSRVVKEQDNVRMNQAH